MRVFVPKRTNAPVQNWTGQIRSSFSWWVWLTVVGARYVTGRHSWRSAVANRVGQNPIRPPYMTVCMVISLTYCVYTVYTFLCMVLANPSSKGRGITPLHTTSPLGILHTLLGWLPFCHHINRHMQAYLFHMQTHTHIHTHTNTHTHSHTRAHTHIHTFQGQPHICLKYTRTLSGIMLTLTFSMHASLYWNASPFLGNACLF